MMRKPTISNFIFITAESLARIVTFETHLEQRTL
jgi:hypothetical protein